MFWECWYNKDSRYIKDTWEGMMMRLNVRKSKLRKEIKRLEGMGFDDGYVVVLKSQLDEVTDELEDERIRLSHLPRINSFSLLGGLR